MTCSMRLLNWLVSIVGMLANSHAPISTSTRGRTVTFRTFA
jgi:hypothetical protein